MTLPNFAQSLSIQWFYRIAKNLHYRGSTEQHFYVWEPHCGYLHKVKKVSWHPLIKEGQLSHKYAF